MTSRPDTGRVTVVVPFIEEHAVLLQRMMASIGRQTVPPHRVEVVLDRDHQGAAWARNQGLTRVETEYVCFADADDELAENHLEVLLEGMRETATDLVYSCIQVIGGRDPLAVAYLGQWVDPCGVPFGPEQERHLRYMGNFIPIGYLAATDMVRKVGGFPPSGGPGREEDYQLLVNLLNAGARFHHVLNQRTYRYHIHDRNTGGGWQGTGASNREAFRS